MAVLYFEKLNRPNSPQFFHNESARKALPDARFRGTYYLSTVFPRTGCMLLRELRLKTLTNIFVALEYATFPACRIPT